MSSELERTSKGSKACVAAQRGLLFHRLRKCELWECLSPTGQAYKSAWGETAEKTRLPLSLSDREVFTRTPLVYSQHLPQKVMFTVTSSLCRACRLPQKPFFEPLTSQSESRQRHSPSTPCSFNALHRRLPLNFYNICENVKTSFPDGNEVLRLP